MNVSYNSLYFFRFSATFNKPTMTDKRYRNDIEAFGKRLRDIREHKEMSQLDLEVESGINRTEISRIETGKKNIELITLFKLASALKVSPAEFFTS